MCVETPQFLKFRIAWVNVEWGMNNWAMCVFYEIINNAKMYSYISDMNYLYWGRNTWLSECINVASVAPKLRPHSLIYVPLDIVVSILQMIKVGFRQKENRLISIFFTWVCFFGYHWWEIITFLHNGFDSHRTGDSPLFKQNDGLYLRIYAALGGDALKPVWTLPPPCYQERNVHCIR